MQLPWQWADSIRARLSNQSRAYQAPPRDGMKRALIVGAGSGGRLLAEELRKNARWGLWPVGYLDDDPGKLGRWIDRLRVLGDVTTMPLVVERERVDTVIVAMPSATSAQHTRVAEIARQTEAEVLTMPPLGSILRGKERTTTLKRVRPTDVLGRPIVEPDRRRCLSFIRGKRVLITGAAGSIGQELARQVMALEPGALTIVDINESDLHDRHQELLMHAPGVPVEPYVASVTDDRRINDLFLRTRPQIVFHAAAYKHVPMMEQQPDEAVRTNVTGTRIVAEAAAWHGAERFVMVSTDKAVRPTSVMGATKRVAEIVVASIADQTGLSACSVRFGNVLGSRGSVIPTFERQIAAGGPVTVTDPRMRRYFMTIPEASGLIIQAGAFGEENVICILDMGEDVSILELAERVIHLHGLEPHRDIAIEYTGIREGEKLREDLANDFETARPSPHPKIRMLESGTSPGDGLAVAERLRRLEEIAERGCSDEIRTGLHDLVRWVDEREMLNGRGAAATTGDTALTAGHRR